MDTIIEEIPTSKSSHQAMNRSKVFAVAIGAVGVVAFFADYINLRSSVTRHLRVEEPIRMASNRPIMTTFFEPVEGGCCGMSQQGHDNLVKSWKRAWEGRGWETRIFTEADARKHPDFELLQNKLIEAKVSEYDRRCFWRWLAMAVDDNPRGGWMSDYDLFPLTLTWERGMEIMKQTGFKSYGGQVPALIHSDQESWDKIVQMMIKTVSPTLDLDFISDMMLLLYLHQHYSEQEMGVTAWEYSIWKKLPYVRVDGQEDPKIDCEVVKTHLAAHLSHRAVQEGFEVTHTYPKIKEEIKEGEYAEFRAQAADVMMKDVDQCLESSVE